MLMMDGGSLFNVTFSPDDFTYPPTSFIWLNALSVGLARMLFPLNAVISVRFRFTEKRTLIKLPLNKFLSYCQRTI